MIVTTVLMAIREIRRNTMRSMLTALGIVIGVAAVIAMITLGRGAERRITADIANMGSDLLILLPGADRRSPTAQTAPPFKLDDAKAISEQVPAVAEVAPASTRSELIVYGGHNWSTTVTGVTDAYFRVRGLTMDHGTRFSEPDEIAGATVCVIGETVRRELFGHQAAIDASIRIDKVSCKVVGTVQSRGQTSFGVDQDDFVLMPLATFQRRIAGNSDVEAIFMSAVSDRDTARAASQVQSLMRQRRRLLPGVPADFYVQDMKELAKTLGTASAALTALLGSIATVSLLVGGIGIMNIMLVSVTERTREIGLRLAIGALRNEVMCQFLVEAVALSTFGGVIGCVVGVTASFGIAHAAKIPFTMPPSIVVLAFVFSTAVGVAFGVLPARRAAALRPIEALRHE